VTADFLKGLIRLAAGVKAREGKPEGARSHAAKARQLFEQVAGRIDAPAPRYLGLALADLVAVTSELAGRPETVRAGGDAPVAVVFSFVLRPRAVNQA
jgi:hypothetical protein